MKVLDKGFVELKDFMGGDQRAVESARVSFDAKTFEMGEKEGKLINYLMKHRHGSPFEHSYFTFHVKAPLFVVREWQRHRIGSYNEMSGRYVEFIPSFYYPDEWRKPALSNKQGSVPFEGTEEIDYLGIEIIYNEAIENAWKYYQFLLKSGIAKEMARMVLPLSLYTQFYWTVNARSLMNFLNLRTGQDAQWEIRQYAETVEDYFANTMPLTYAAWVSNERLAP